MNNEAPKLLSLPELAKALNLPAKWLKAESDAGRLPHLRVKNRYRFDHDAIIRVLAERSVSGWFDGTRRATVEATTC